MFLYFSFQSIKSHYIKYLTDELITYSELFITIINQDNILSNHNRLDSIVKTNTGSLNKRITVIDTDGKVIADSKTNPALMENHSSRPEILQAKTAEYGVSLRYSETVKKDMLYVAVPIKSAGNTIAYMRLSMYVIDVKLLIDDLKNNIIQITIFAVSISVLFILFFSSRISNPIKQLVKASKQVAVGDFKTKVIIKNKDEMKDLADSFNYMTEHINSLFNMLNNEKEKLDGLIKSLNEGFIVLDSDGILVLANSAFANICGKTDIIGKYYWEIIDINEFSDFVKQIKLEKTNLSQELAINDKYYLCSANFLENREQYVIIMHDITNHKQLEQIKKDFIVNVSHELRTPLTAIKGFVETMEDDAREDQMHYLDIIHRHSDRLILIVNDLMLLSKLEHADNSFVLNEINFPEYLNNLIPLFDQKLKQKHIELILDIDKSMPIVYADAYKLEQLFINLIDNAIKYTDEGKISVCISPQANNYIIEITDSGIGIAKDKLDRIFERFYVIDKSRSRKVGGTGLGLSIVKHIVLAHKGEIKVASDTGLGTKFTITLPYLTK